MQVSSQLEQIPPDIGRMASIENFSTESDDTACLGNSVPVLPRCCG